jgi:hypothetical protein
MQFVPSGSQPRRGRDRCTEPDIGVGFEHQRHAPELTLAVPAILIGSIRKTF